MNFDWVNVAVAPLAGISLSVLLSFLKGLGLSGDRSKNIVLGSAFVYLLIYAVGSQLAAPVSVLSLANSAGNGILGALIFLFGAEGFYQRVQKAEKRASEADNAGFDWTGYIEEEDDYDEEEEEELAPSKKRK